MEDGGHIKMMLPGKQAKLQDVLQGSSTNFLVIS